MTKYSSTVTLECHLLSSSTHSIAASLSPTRTASGQRRCKFLSVSSVMILNAKKIKCPCLRCSFWDWEKAERLDYFFNGNPRYTRITAMEYLNGHDCSLLLTATGKERTITCTWIHTFGKDGAAEWDYVHLLCLWPPTHCAITMGLICSSIQH